MQVFPQKPHEDFELPGNIQPFILPGKYTIDTADLTDHDLAHHLIPQVSKIILISKTITKLPHMDIGVFNSIDRCEGRANLLCLCKFSHKSLHMFHIKMNE